LCSRDFGDRERRKREKQMKRGTLGVICTVKKYKKKISKPGEKSENQK